MSRQLHGVGGAPGVALGRAVRYQAQISQATPGDDGDMETALARFAAAQVTAAERLQAIADQFHAEGHDHEAGIFEAQALLVEDAVLVEDVTRRMREDGESLDTALDATLAQMRAALEALDDSYLRERAADIDAVGMELRKALHGGSSLDAVTLPPDAIIVAPDLTPSETAGLRGSSVAGFATAYGGPTSHTAILARSLGIPAVVGLGAAALAIADATPLILDGEPALLIVNPSDDEQAAYAARRAVQQAAREMQQAYRDEPGQLADGQRVALWANIGHPDEARLALEYGAEGIGLFRTEFLFLDRAAPPDEQEQYDAYRAVLEIMAGRTVVVRTLDIGGDKPLPYLDMPHEANPFLGVRGLRLCMQRTDLFLPQLRALLRAALHGDLWIMLPMVTTPDDLRWGREQVQAAAAALQTEGVEHRADVPLGIMIETPAAAVTADLLARDAAFFSVGSNDLAQYTMAADRGQAELAVRYQHDAPAVLRLIRQAAEAARHAGIPIGICGELGGVPEAAPVLVGLGLDELSMAPAAIPLVKERLRSVTLAEAQVAARERVSE